MTIPNYCIITLMFPSNLSARASKKRAGTIWNMRSQVVLETGDLPGALDSVLVTDG